VTEEVRAWRVSGRVQGVGFRWWTARTARRLSLSGSVRNRDDASVEVVARGAPERLHELERALRSGPLGAKVAAVEVLPAPADMPAGDFRILH
jgi:acylphosphatase